MQYFRGTSSEHLSKQTQHTGNTFAGSFAGSRSRLRRRLRPDGHSHFEVSQQGNYSEFLLSLKGEMTENEKSRSSASGRENS
jgi:flagellar biosynthesis chaperone FliJ